VPELYFLLYLRKLTKTQNLPIEKSGNSSREPGIEVEGSKKYLIRAVSNLMNN
jgi:hypothetical protein